jgi:hypothetical protein
LKEVLHSANDRDSDSKRLLRLAINLALPPTLSPVLPIFEIPVTDFENVS